MLWSLVAFLVSTVLADVAQGTCHTPEELFYREIGCRPDQTDKDGCAVSYDCNSIKQRAKDQCHYKGRVYTPGQRLETDPQCLADCHCGNVPDITEIHTFTCANVECPDLFSGPPRPGCYRSYTHDKCCSVEEICEAEAASKTPQVSCSYAGQSYKEGQRFYPDEEPCMKCICQAGFNGTLMEPFCKTFECNLELHYGDRIAAGCVPVYYGSKGCCPIDWKCPEKTDTVVALDGSSATPGKMCEFGTLKMQIGEKLNTKNDTKCICKVPPHPICIQDETS